MLDGDKGIFGSRWLWRGLLLAVLVSLLPGCGFHLRGASLVPKSLDPVYVQARPHSALARELKLALKDSEVTLAAEPGQAQGLIRILKEKYGRRVLSVDGRGKVVEYELHFQVQFDGINAKGEPLVERQSVDLVRTFLNEDIEVLGKQEEAELLREDMEDEMANRIIFRLRAQLK